MSVEAFGTESTVEAALGAGGFGALGSDQAIHKLSSVMPLIKRWNFREGWLDSALERGFGR